MGEPRKLGFVFEGLKGLVVAEALTVLIVLKELAFFEVL